MASRSIYPRNKLRSIKNSSTRAMSTTNDDFIDNFIGDKDFSDVLNDNNDGETNDEKTAVPTSVSTSEKTAVPTNSSTFFEEGKEIYNGENLIGFQCPAVIEKNPQLPDIPLTFYMDLMFPLGDEAAAVRQVQLGIISALASDYRIASGKACTDPPTNGSSWLVSVRSELDQVVREPTFDLCRELIEATPSYSPEESECYVYEFSTTLKSLTGSSIPDVEGVLATLLANQVALDPEYKTKFLAVPRLEKPKNETPSSLNGNEKENVPLSRNTITLVGGILVAAFCIASVGILCILWGRRKSQLQERENQLDQTYAHTQTKQFSNSTEDSDDEFDEEYNRRTANRSLDMSSTLGQQVFRAHSSAANSRPKYLSNVNSTHGPYSHFQNDGTSHFRQSSLESVDSWAQADGTIGSLELHLEPITGEI
eukprot:scaffold4901_cov105-Cylindrotheca_fusiformis.AAC.7